MCTVSTDYSTAELDAEQQRLINQALATSTTTPPPVTAPATDTAADDAAFAIPGKTGVAGGGDKGMLETAVSEGLNPATGLGEGADTPTTPPATPPEAIAPGANPGQTSGNTGFNAQAYLAAYPGVLDEFARHTSSADQKYLASLGVYTAEDFAAWHYNTYGKAGGFNPQGQTVGNATGAVNQGNQLLTDLTSGINNAIKTLAETTAAQIAALNTNNTGLTQQIGELTKGFQTSQQELLDNMNKSAAEQSQQFTKALKDMRDAGNSSGQLAKKPNYGRALQRNKELNSAGLSATMLTGPTGIAPGVATLGRTSLLGA